MKAATAAGEKCNAERDAAVATFLSEWERTTYATAIYYLNAAALTAIDPQKGSNALHAFGESVGPGVRRVDVQPGPPVLSASVAEIYGPEAEGRRSVPAAVRRSTRSSRRSARHRRTGSSLAPGTAR